MYFERTLKNLTIAVILLLNCLRCGGQIDLKENIQTKSDMATIEISDSNLFVNNSPQKDSIIYNQYLNHKKDGLWKEFDKNHQLRSEGNYKDGEKQGLHKEWEENGQLGLEGYYTNGKANGLMKWYWEGTLIGYGNMKDGKRDGLWKICDLHNGSNCIEAYYRNGKAVGIWKLYHDNGQLWREQNWNDNKLVSEKCWDENGNKIKCD